MAASAAFALKPGVWFRRGRLLIVSPDSLGTACLLSGRNSTYRPVQISETSSIIVIASHSTKIVAIASVLIYAAGLLAMLGFSAAYSMWPVSHTKWILRRFDHSAIYLLIAGTYTPFIAQLKNSFVAGGLLTGVWLTV